MTTLMGVPSKHGYDLLSHCMDLGSAGRVTVVGCTVPSDLVPTRSLFIIAVVSHMHYNSSTLGYRKLDRKSWKFGSWLALPLLNHTLLLVFCKLSEQYSKNSRGGCCRVSCVNALACHLTCCVSRPF